MTSSLCGCGASICRDVFKHPEPQVATSTPPVESLQRQDSGSPILRARLHCRWLSGLTDLADATLTDSLPTLHMLLSQNRGKPMWTRKYYNPHYRDPQKGAKISGNRHILPRSSCWLSLSSMAETTETTRPGPAGDTPEKHPNFSLSCFLAGCRLSCVDRSATRAVAKRRHLKYDKDWQGYDAHNRLIRLPACGRSQT